MNKMRISTLNANAHGLAVHSCCFMYINQDQPMLNRQTQVVPGLPIQNPFRVSSFACNFLRMLVWPMSRVKHAKKSYPPNIMPRNPSVLSFDVVDANQEIVSPL